MQKEKRSKKRYTWKQKHKGKRSKKPMFCNAPKSYCKPYWEAHRAKEKNEIVRFINGVDESNLNFPFNHKHCASWDYW
jgi:hypothetical protein